MMSIGQIYLNYGPIKSEKKLCLIKQMNMLSNLNSCIICSTIDYPNVLSLCNRFTKGNIEIFVSDDLYSLLTQLNNFSAVGIVNGHNYNNVGIYLI